MKNRCLCCFKELSNDEPYYWHKKCLKNFFGYQEMPEFDLKESNVALYASGMLESKKSVTGVQSKMSLHSEKCETTSRLTLIGEPLGYILKPKPQEYPMAPISEFIVMHMARISKISVCPFGLLKMKDNEYAYISKRVDRKENSKIHMEDFCQLSERLTEDKYKSSYERCAKIIEKYSSIKKLDTVSLFERIVFSFITCNSDMHLKNFSLIEKKNGDIELSPAYDLLPAKLLVKDDNEDLALTINGKKRNLRKGDFVKYGISIGLDEKVINRIINRFIGLKNEYVSIIDDSMLDADFKERFKTQLLINISRLS